MSQFQKSTKGYNGPIFVAKAINYTTDATLAAFMDNAPLGELGVYDANGALHDNAITSGEKVQIVMRTTNGIKRTPLFKWSEVTATKKAYVAPVKQVSSLGWAGTGGSLNAGTIVKGRTYEMGVIETTPGNDPFPTWNYDYQAKTNDAQIDIMRGLAKKINDARDPVHVSNERLVSAKVKADATYGNYALGGTTPTLTVTNGSTTVLIGGGGSNTMDATLGDLISFDAAAAPTDAVGDIYKIVSLVANTSFELDRPYQGATQVFTEAEGEGTRVKKVTSVVEAGLELTALNYDEHFRIVVRENLDDADITYTTPFTKGNGTYTEVLSDELEGKIWEGGTAVNSEYADKYGVQDTFAVSGETYDAYHLSLKIKAFDFPPHHELAHFGMITIYTAKSTGNADSTLDTLFGL